MTSSLVLIPSDAADRIRNGGRWGKITTRASVAENTAAITHLSVEHGPILPVELPKNHWLSHADTHPSGRWYRVTADLHAAWCLSAARKGTGIPISEFSRLVPTNLHPRPHIAVTYSPDATLEFPGVGLPELLGWHVTDDAAIPMDVEVSPHVWGTEQLRAHWPVNVLEESTVMVVGAGSIGGAAALELATYGIGELHIVDPDRLRWHNLIRHIGSQRDVGRLKVNALHGQITSTRPDTNVRPHDLDVVSDADTIFSLLTKSDVVLCAADGVAPRRTISHLARRANIDAVMACVLENGTLGEIVRIRPWAGRGCLLCHRRHLRDTSALDPEPTLDAGYETGSTHQPMTAVGGDLHLVAALAAKATVATILERRGHPAHRLPGEHAVLGLHPNAHWAAPFDVKSAGDIKWSGAWPSYPDCITCGP
ncbi:ThiF family adenylyltransferase [Gordonia sp. CPCC 205515]|uniref:HesA/MoeB/ThiF family protein n=1 Tax=Gordonia sp. CPCC 205515 TaxID=3140791 RepID=UPI003AF3935C